MMQGETWPIPWLHLTVRVTEANASGTRYLKAIARGCAGASGDRGMNEALLRTASAVALCAIVYGGVLLYQAQLSWTIGRKAEAAALAWMDYIDHSFPDLGRPDRTGALSVAERDALRPAMEALDVVGFGIVGPGGQTGVFHGLTAGPDGAAAFPPGRRTGTPAVADAGRATVRLLGDVGQPGGPGSLAEVRISRGVHGANAGTAVVRVDTAEARAETEAAFARFAALLGALGLAALAIPTLHWARAWRETRRTNAALKDKALTEAQLSREVRLIGELNGWLQSSRSQGELFDMVAGFLTRLLPACEGEIYVYANSRDVLLGCAGWAGAMPRDHIHPEECWSLRRGRTYQFGVDEIAFACAHVGSDDRRCYFCMPLLAHGETVGLLHLRMRRGGDRDAFLASRHVAQLCAEQISMAIANVRMRDELHDQSIRDALTGLFNRRHLAETLRRHLDRNARSGTGLALLSIDVDHFKRFNDNYGHDAGDMVLRAVGGVLDRATDGDELAARPGGEEFMVVLPATDVADALHRAESIRESIQKISIRYGEKTLPSVTASIGVALAPADGTAPQDLIRAADRALYAAKSGGRNRAVLTTLIDVEAEGCAPGGVPPCGGASVHPTVTAASAEASSP